MTLAVTTVAAALVLAGCSSGSKPASSASPTGIPTATAGGAVVPYAATVSPGISVKGSTQHQPKVTIAPGTPEPTRLIAQDLVIGTGAVANSKSTVSVSYIGVRFKTGKIFNNTYPAGQSLRIALPNTIPAWIKGIPGMRVGGVRAIVAPTADAYGSTPPAVEVEGPLVFVVELQSLQ